MPPKRYFIAGAIVALSLMIHWHRKGKKTVSAYVSELLMGPGYLNGQDGAQDDKKSRAKVQADTEQKTGHGKKRIVWLDYVRGLAAVLVIITHVAGNTADQLAAVPGEAGVFRFVESIGNCCNLLFLMMSGALLLGEKPQPLGKFYLRRMTAVVVPLFAYFLFYRWYYLGGASIWMPSSWYELLRSFLANDSGMTPHFWLVYEIIAFYIAAPFLAQMMQALDERQMIGLMAVVLAVHTIFTYLPWLGFTFGASTFLASWVSVFLLGYLCMTDVAMRYYRLFLGGGAISVFLVAVGVFRGWNVPALFLGNAPTMLLIGCAVFLFFRRHGETIFSKMARIPALIVQNSFSILLIHWFVYFVVVQQWFGVTAMRYGTILSALGGIALTLAGSLVFAILYDNTVVLCLKTVVLRLFRRIP